MKSKVIAAATLVAGLGVHGWAQAPAGERSAAATPAHPHAPDSVVATAAPASSRRIVVSIPDRKLALIVDGRVVSVYRVAVGVRVSPSPVGAFRIVNRISNPGYYHPHKVILGAKDNPIGTRWIGLNQQHYGIHGTNEPQTIGRAASHGCIRMRNRDVEEFFAQVRVGDLVEIRADRDAELTEIFEPRSGGASLAASLVATSAVKGGM